MTYRFKGLLLAALLLTSCGRSTPLAPDDVLALRITPDDPGLYLNQVVQLTVEGHFVDGVVLDLTGDPELLFRLNNNGIIEVLAEGKILGRSPGSVRLFAAYAGRETFIDVVVHDASLAGIQVTPPQLQLDPGDYLQLEVLGLLSDGALLDLTRGETGTVYSSDDLTVASATTDGLVFAQEGGQTTIRVEQGEFLETVPVTVGEPSVLESIGVSPSSATLSPGDTLQLEVFGYYQDGSVANLTRHGDTEYSSSDSSVAQAIDGGQVQALGRGACEITISHLGYLASVSIQVIDGVELVDLRIDPPEAILSLGGFIQLRVVAEFSDGSEQDVTPESEFSSNDPLVLEVNQSGLVTGRSPGQSRVEASFTDMSAGCEVRVEDRTLVSIDVQPDEINLEVTESIALWVIGTYDDGSHEDLTGHWTGTTYQSSLSSVAAVDLSGVVQAYSAGECNIQAGNSGHTDSMSVTVVGSQLESVELEPASLQLDVGESAQLTLWAIYTDGSRLEVTDLGGYTTTDGTVARVTRGGLVSGQGPGSTMVSAEFGGLTADCLVTVESQLTSIEVQPQSALLDIGDSLQLVVIAYYSDGGSQDVTALSTFITSNSTVAAVTIGGLVTARTEGSVVITAYYSGLSSEANLQVLAPVLVSLETAPSSLVLEVGEAVQLTVWAEYSDGSRQNVAAMANYQSTDPQVAGVSLGGLVSALAPGNATIRASFGGLVATCPVAVGGVEVIDLDVEPSSATLDIGETLQLTVTITWSDGQQEDVTYSAGTGYWSDDPAIASVGATGLVSAAGPGLVSVYAQAHGFEDTCQVRVLTPQLISVAVEPPSAQLEIDETLQLIVRAFYSDGSVDVVTTQASYDSSDPMVASVQGSGLVTALSQGPATVSATFQGLSGSCQVQVLPPALVDVRVVPTFVDLDLGGSTWLTVWADYSDGSSEIVTLLASYDSSDPMVAAPQGNGQVLAVGPGSAMITATFGGLSDGCLVNVSPVGPVLESIELTPQTADLILGEFLQFGVIGHYSDGSQDDLTLASSGTTYQLSVAGVLDISSDGLAQALAYGGPVTVTARNSGFFDTASVTVTDNIPPVVSTLSPDSAIQGTTVRVVFYGSGLSGCSVAPVNPGIAVSAIVYSPDGTQLSATFTVDSDAGPGSDPVILSKPVGSTQVTFTVIEDTPLPDLIIGPGEVVYLSGVQAYHNISIGTGAVVYGVGLQPLQFLATGDIMVRGEIWVNGHPGADGYYETAVGGDGGPGGGGGGGAGDGDAPVPASGGDGSPPGENGGPAQGPGTASGDGGGTGAGSGIAGGCGQAGGGGAFGGDGGHGGGDLGIGTGGPGGLANTQGSNYNGGTGGGGGSTCGPNSGGGGGGGGGVLVLSSVTGGTIVIRGALYADGGRGGDGYAGTGGGGGASGGRITVTTAGGAIVVEDTISTHGGDGGRSDAGDGGGGGGGGRIIVDAGGGTIDDQWGYYDVRGGLGGESRDDGFNGEPGELGVADIRP